MLGLLPRTLNICGKEYAIRADYRNILQIFVAFADTDLKDDEKVYVCLKRLYADFERIPRSQYKEAYEAAYAFIACDTRPEKGPSPQLVNWEKDEQLIFPAINKVAGREVRELPFLHWWSFLGYFQSIDRDDLWGFVLTIRQKRSKKKRLEKHEQEFYRANKELCAVESTKAEAPKTVEDELQSLFKSLAAEGGED